jgi:hypothetical protein
MAGGRQAWCPRCDELRAARPGGSCPVCGRPLLAVPPARPGLPEPGPANRLWRRLRGLLPAAGAVGTALLVAAVVASAFAAGRQTGTTPAAGAAASTTPAPGDGRDAARRDFGWEAQDSGVTVRLRSISVGVGYSRLELRVLGVPRGREISVLQRLRVRDAAGNDLVPGGELTSVSTVASRPAPGGGIDAEVILHRALDQQAVAAVELGGLTVARHVEDRLQGSLVDPELRRRADSSFDNATWLAERRSCPSCRLQIDCPSCRTIRIAGQDYRRGRVMVLLEAVGPLERSAINPARRRVVVTDAARVSEMSAWIDGTGPTAVVSIGSESMLYGGLGATVADDPMLFQILVQSQAEQPVAGAWTIRAPGDTS